MNYAGPDTVRIAAEYERRSREIAPGFYSWSKPPNLLLHTHVVRACIPVLDRAGLYPLTGQRVLDVGCGEGTWLLEFLQWGANPPDVAGIDLSPQRAERTQQRISGADIRNGSASSLPWPDESFDLVSQFTVFTSMLDPALRTAVASEMLRVLKPAGSILWFDFRVDNPNNKSVRGVRAREVRELFPNCTVDLYAAVLAPPLARLIAPYSWPLAEWLHSIPFLRTHYVGLIRKRQ